MISSNAFARLAQVGYSHIPLIKLSLTDDKTPVWVFAALKTLYPDAYLFESVEGGERFGRYSIIGLLQEVRFCYQDGEMQITQAGRTQRKVTDAPFELLNAFMSQYKVPTLQEMPELPAFFGGLVGYFGYDLVRVLEPSLGKGSAVDALNMPDLWLMLSRELVVFDNLKHTLSVIVLAEAQDPKGYAQASARVHEIEQLIHTRPSLKCTPCPAPVFTSATGKKKFCQDVLTIKDYILAGDVMQVVPAQRLSASFAGDALSVYRALRYLNPSPYLFLFKTQDFDLIGASPEILSRVADGKVTVRPLAGTRKRGKTDAEDLALEKELLSDQKELAEHLMLIDLGRNDIGRVCKVGTVKATQKMFIERYSQVMHIASNVEGEIKDGINALDVFCATFPAGTLSGAPKIRAMQIIDELEPVRRTVFGGAIGYLGFDGKMDTAIAIRTAVQKDGRIHIQAGAGVVADSIPEAEWEETNNKAAALIKAVELACRGLVLDE